MDDLSFDDIISLSELAEIVTVDIEGVNRMLGFSICFDGLGDGFYLPFTHNDRNMSDAQQDKIFKVLETRKALVFHNAIHDLRGLYRHGFDYKGLFYDTMLMCHWLDEELPDYSLDKLSVANGGKPKAMSQSMSILIDEVGWDELPYTIIKKYGGNDAYITHELFNKKYPQFKADGFDSDIWHRDERQFIKIMGEMIDLGIKVDQAFCVREYMKGIAIMDTCKAELKMNPGSNIQMRKLLIEEMGLPVVSRTPKGAPSFDKKAMEKYDILLEKTKDTRAQTILTYRGWSKTTGSNYKPYMELVDSNAVLHPGYRLHRTVTGRLACEKPALQQIPKTSDKVWNGGLKKAFIARPTYNLWEVDYSQLQFRMAVAYGVVEELIEIFNDPTRDIFNEMAIQMAWLRQDVKTLVYLILFGGGANRAADSFGVSVEQGGQLVNEFHTMYPGMKEVANECAKVARAQGYVKYWTGRRRHFKPYWYVDENGRKKKGLPKYYRAFNAVIQGGEAEIMKRAMIALRNNVCSDDCRMVLQIHDAIAFEIREGMENEYLPKIVETMEAAPQAFCDFVGTHVDFRVEAKRWGEK